MKLSYQPIVDQALKAPQTMSLPATKPREIGSDLSPLTELTDNSRIKNPQQSQSLKSSQPGIWGIFSSTFLTIFLAEMGDKTQLATLLMSAQSQSPWVVFAGAATALIATSLLGVLIGRWLATRLSPKTLETSAGALLLFISVMLLWDIVHF
ncbi:MAG: TMEM165/GDT1 family protein [Cyanobacteriota bacterium]